VSKAGMTTQRLKFTPFRLLHAPPWLDRGSKKRHPQRYKKTEIPSDDTFRGFLKATDFQEAQFCGAIVTARTESGICRLNNALLDMAIAKQSFRGVRSPIEFGNESKMNAAQMLHECCSKWCSGAVAFEGDDWHGFATSDLADFPMSQKVAKRL
jgi:hypothetical protein